MNTARGRIIEEQLVETEPARFDTALKEHDTMAKRRTLPVLPGLSRSTHCSATKSCLRLSGHKGSHRASRMATKSPTVVAKVAKVAKATPSKMVVEKGVEVLSADKYEVLVSRCDDCGCHKAPAPKAPAKARRSKTVRGKVTIVPMDAKRSRRMVADTTNGQFRTARRAKAAPAGRRDVTIREQVATA